MTALKKLGNFNGFDFDEELDDKTDYVCSVNTEKINQVCDVLGVDKKGVKQDIAERVVEFLQCPEDYFYEIK